eukprot:TRINITY_DN27199_c0_g2_i1.p1 TRINITY_DN27199_c0_g2~~TRINITY_DN27199_c0_g2_i1.p1  ORF type:complete len:382 (-),score=29.76 TRINITY_DN27199_c0_g2_i1:227-1372(-)
MVCISIIWSAFTVGLADAGPKLFVPPSDLSIESCALSHRELSFFQDTGFLVKPGLLSSDSVQELLDATWNEIERGVTPLGVVDRLRPETWLDPQWGTTEPTLPDVTWSTRGGPRAPIWHVRGDPRLKLHGMGADPVMRRVVLNSTALLGVARLLLGRPLKAALRTRGVYPIFPSSRGITELRAHSDEGAQQLNFAVYLDEVSPRGGGFTVYPGSHRELYFAHEEDSNWSPRGDALGEAEDLCMRSIAPLEIPGKAGDVIFWHGRLLHSPGVHLNQDRIRFAVFGDLVLQPPGGQEAFLSESELRNAGLHMFWIDSGRYRKDRPSHPSDMFHRWALRADEGLPCRRAGGPGSRQEASEGIMRRLNGSRWRWIRGIRHDHIFR